MRIFLAAALGGSALYRGRDMRSAHAGLGITPADWDATVGHLVATLETLAVPAELIGEVASRVLPLRDQICRARSVNDLKDGCERDTHRHDRTHGRDLRSSPAMKQPLGS